MTTLYHGSYVAVPNPIVLLGRQNLDFGQGFYLTSVRAQAEAWALIVARWHRDGIPTLGTYSFGVEQARNVAGDRYRVFAAYDFEWLEYVIDCRNGGKLQDDYDVIEGGVANDNVIDTVELFEKGYLTAQQAIDQLAYKKVNHQICIRNQAIADSCLKFLEASEVTK